MSPKIKYPICGHPQSLADSLMRLKIWFDLKPKSWKCVNCRHSLSFTLRGVVLFWFICFPAVSVAVYLLFREKIVRYPPWVSLAVVFVIGVTLLLSLMFRKAVFRIRVTDESGI